MISARVLSLCMAMALVSACHHDSDAPAPSAPTPHVRVAPPAKKGPTAAELTQGMVEATTVGKSELAVDLKFDLPQRPVPGQPLDVSIAVMPHIDAGGGSIEAASGDGLTVDSASLRVDLPAVEAGQVYRQNLRVTPTLEGVLLLNLTISLKRDELNESRVFSIPLIVAR